MDKDHTQELVTISTEDGRLLDALWYRSATPRDQRTAVAHVHGKGDNFYSGPGRFLPPRLTGHGIDHLSFNMRFHDLGYTRSDYEGGRTTDFGVDGGMWESIENGKRDLAAATEWLRTRGYARIYLSGHSAGGYYVGEYAALDDGLAGRILLSPLQDHRFVFRYWFPQEGQLEAAVEEAQRMIAAGRGQHLIPVDGWYYAISAHALVERAAQKDGVWMDAMQASDAPVLMVWGTEESRAQLWSELFAQFSTADKTSVAIEGGDHFYVGHEDTLAATILDFINAH